ncbi:hypothetical protein ABIA33_002265 [Streptacidiphilus sp. MAP12-16]
MTANPTAEVGRAGVVSAASNITHAFCIELPNEAVSGI